LRGEAQSVPNVRTKRSHVISWSNIEFCFLIAIMGVGIIATMSWWALLLWLAVPAFAIF
jgi:hypothetical protein